MNYFQFVNGNSVLASWLWDSSLGKQILSSVPVGLSWLADLNICLRMPQLLCILGWYEHWEGHRQSSCTALTHWGLVTHIWVSKLTIIGSDNGLSPRQHQVIIRTNAVILTIRPKGTYFGEILLKIKNFSLKKMHLKMSSAKWRPFCLRLNVLTHWGRDKMDAISQTTFSRAFSSMKIVVFWLDFHLNMFERVQFTIIQNWFR